MTLVRHLAVIARNAGIRELIAEVLPHNAAMLKAFERAASVLVRSAVRDRPCRLLSSTRLATVAHDMLATLARYDV